MASMAFLLLGAAVSFVASVDPTLQLEAFTQKARRMQELTLLPLPAGCASACPDFQSAYDEMECLASKGEEEYFKGTAGLFSATSQPSPVPPHKLLVVRCSETLTLKILPNRWAAFAGIPTLEKCMKT